MSKIGRRLSRIVDLYSTLEHARLADMQRAALMLREAEVAIAMQDSIRSDAMVLARTAVQRDDRMGLTLAESQFALAGWNRERLERARCERNALYDVAQERHRLSRVESEQMRRLFERSKLQSAILDGRKAQVVLDDRFLSRRRWLSLQRSNE